MTLSKLVLATITVKYSTDFHSYDIVKADLFQLVRLIKVQGNSHGCFQQSSMFSGLLLFRSARVFY